MHIFDDRFKTMYSLFLCSKTQLAKNVIKKVGDLPRSESQKSGNKLITI